MNKAFVKEEVDNSDVLDFEYENNEDDTGLIEDDLPLVGGPKNYITQLGFERLRAELDHLLSVERPKAAELAIETERKKALRDIEKRIRFLQRRTDIAEVVNPEEQTGDRVLFGATVTVKDENELTRIYKIVGVDETDAKDGKVSWSSPVGKALLQARAGDFVTVHTPHGEEELEIIEIEYKPIR